MKHESELENQIKAILLDLRFIDRPSDVIFAVRTFIKHAYPIHDLGREIHVRKLRDFLKSKGVWSIGRFGSWHYSSLGDAISEAFETVREM